MEERLPEDELTDKEPRVASQPPEDVVIPVETAYGSNLPVEPPKKTTAPEHGTESGAKTSGGSIRVPIWIFLPLLGGLLAGAFYAGSTKTTKIVEKPVQQEPQNEKKKRTNFLQDAGIYSRENAINCWDLLPSRLEAAKETIFVITGYPGDPHLLNELTAKKRATGLPIFLLTGNDTPEREIVTAKEAGFQVYKLKTTLERPYTVLLIDKKIVLDISRENWVWESSEPHVIKAVAKWAEDLASGAELK